MKEEMERGFSKTNIKIKLSQPLLPTIFVQNTILKISTFQIPEMREKEGNKGILERYTDKVSSLHLVSIG